ncbi:hypothetical protein M8J75_011203 [Diaphorina citri]|nr:hypothetical protein M8J75_011203 [Diaphorina citri]
MTYCFRTFSNVKRLEHIEPGVFNLLKELRSIYIHYAPLLRRIPSGVFQLYLPRLIYLRIVHTGLEKLPYFGRLKTNAALHMIDLENNQIQAISSHEVEVHTDQLQYFRDSGRVTTIKEVFIVSCSQTLQIE